MWNFSQEIILRNSLGQLLRKDRVVIHEAAIRFNQFFVCEKTRKCFKEFFHLMIIGI